MDRIKRLAELKEELHKLNDEMIALRRKEHELLEEERKLKKEELADYLGRCYEDKYNFYCITDVPQEEWTKTGTHFNEYQLPCLVIKKEGDSPEDIYEDTFFIGKLRNNPPLWKEQAHEVSVDVFRKALNEKVALIHNVVLLAGQRRPPLPQT